MSTLDKTLPLRKRVFVNEEPLTEETQDVTKEDEKSQIDSQKNIELMRPFSSTTRWVNLIKHYCKRTLAIFVSLFVIIMMVPIIVVTKLSSFVTGDTKTITYSKGILESSFENIYLFSKRVFDIVASAFGLVFLLPITLIIKISYVLSGDHECVIFKQKRIGQYGKEFNFYKYRSMIPNADEALFQYLEENEEARKEYSINKKLKDDPRITKIGKFLRRSSIDELPQLINIFLGQMSLVGNRPYLPREKEDMGSYYQTIVQTKPGLTGYWQVSGRSETAFTTRLELENYYSEHASIPLDLKIFFKTFSVVLKKKGAK